MAVDNAIDGMGLVLSSSIAAHNVIQKFDPRGLIKGLDEEVSLRAVMLVFGLAIVGYGRARVLSCRRTLLEEQMYYGFGRTAIQCRKAGVDPSLARPSERRVTSCLPEDSDHGRGMALDVDFSMYHLIEPAVIGPVCRALDVEWGGFWKSRDYGHFGFRRRYNGSK
jgi:hypothetical protein